MLSKWLKSLVVIAVLLAGTARVQAAPPDEPKNCITESIHWVLPGNFADALSQADRENRMLLVKGLGFGLDELGAQCATKGCW